MSNDPSAALPQSAKVFISYRREDSAGHAGRLYDRIGNYFGDRIKIFMDIDSIGPGEDFINVIENAVGACEILIAVIGRDWLTVTDETGKRRLDNPEDFIRVEVATALNRNIRVIPVLVQGASMPRREQLPAPLANLSRRNAIEVSDARWKYDVDRLIKTIEEVSSLKPTVGPTGGQGIATVTGRSRLWSWPTLAVIGIGLLLIIGMWQLIPLISKDSSGGNSNYPSNSNLSVSGTGLTTSNTNSNSTEANTKSSTSTPPETSVSPTSPAAVETQTGIQVVRVRLPNGFARGFFTYKGYVIAMVATMLKASDNTTVEWSEGGQNHTETAQVIRTEHWTALLKLNKGLLPRHAPIRNSNSLQRGDDVERLLGPQDKTPGKVLDVQAKGMVPGVVLLTTKISSAGDAGSPVVDSKGRIVAMVLGGSVTETQSLPIERIKLMFPEAF